MVVSVNGTSTDLTSLSVPDIYVDVEAPPSVDSSGVSTNRIGLVGTASWGPVNSPTSVGAWAAYKAKFGTVKNRTHDMGTFVYLCLQLGAAAFRLVRVTDGTDVAASVEIQTNCLNITSKYTGSLANSDKVTIANGTASGSYKVTISRSGLTPETFDNITGSGNALWIAIADALNNGLSSVRGASSLVVATAGAGTDAPTLGSYSLSGGTDGATSITSAILIGEDGSSGSRTGMYALRGTGAALGACCDLTDANTWGTQLTYSLSEQLQMVGVSPAGDTLDNFSSIQTQDSPWFKAIFGDWIYWYDSINDITRLVSPQAFYLGEKIAVGVQNSVLNKEISIVVGTQSSENNITYSSDDLSTLTSARGDVICKPCPGGDYFGFRFGRNTSSSQVTHQDNYTTLVDYIALSLNKSCGQYVGRLLSTDEQKEAKHTIEYFLENLADNDFIGNSDGTTPYSVTIASGTAGTGTQKAIVKVQFFDVVEYFIVDLTAGASVTISSQTSSSSSD